MTERARHQIGAGPSATRHRRAALVLTVREDDWRWRIIRGTALPLE